MTSKGVQMKRLTRNEYAKLFAIVQLDAEYLTTTTDPWDKVCARVSERMEKEISKYSIEQCMKAQGIKMKYRTSRSKRGIRPGAAALVNRQLRNDVDTLAGAMRRILARDGQAESPIYEAVRELNERGAGCLRDENGQAD